MKEQIQNIITSKNKHHKDKSQRTIFNEILSSELLPQEKTLDRLMQEGQVMIAAGTETTAWTLSVTTYYMLANPEIYAKTKEELNIAVGNTGANLTLNQLEQLPYLNAVISEGLRLSYGVTTRLQRSSPDEVLIYNNWRIPRGVGNLIQFSFHYFHQLT